MVIDAVARLLPEVIREESPEEESWSLMDADGTPLLEYPQYTRPAEFRDKKVPDILLSGNHAEIAKWRLQQARERTAKRTQDTDATL
jgi:tRNA (guanine37-N1)-methyltransferase